MRGAVVRMKKTIEQWSHPDAPEMFAKGRRCEAILSKCATAEQMADSGQRPERGKVSTYAKKIKGILLCEACRRKCLRENLEPTELTHVRVPLPGPKRTGFHLRNLRDARKARGMSRDQLALKADCKVKTLDGVEGGRHRPSLGLINRFAAALGVRVRELRGSESEEAA